MNKPNNTYTVGVNSPTVKILLICLTFLIFFNFNPLTAHASPDFNNMSNLEKIIYFNENNNNFNKKIPEEIMQDVHIRYGSVPANVLIKTNWADYWDVLVFENKTMVPEYIYSGGTISAVGFVGNYKMYTYKRSNNTFYREVSPTPNAYISNSTDGGGGYVYSALVDDNKPYPPSPDGNVSVDFMKEGIYIDAPISGTPITGNEFFIKGKIVAHYENFFGFVLPDSAIQSVKSKVFDSMTWTIPPIETGLIKLDRQIKIGDKKHSVIFSFIVKVKPDVNFKGEYIITSKTFFSNLRTSFILDFTKDADGGIANPDFGGGSGSSEDIDKPSRPDGLNPVDWIIYILDLFIYYINYLFNLIMRLFDSLYGAFVNIVQYSNNIGGMLQGLYSWLPPPIPDLVNTSFIVIIVLSVIRYLRG